jgi:hypothetical protein
MQPPRSGLVQPLSILTTDIGFAEITATKFTPSINKLSIILFASISNILGQYSINIPAHPNLAHKPSAGLRTPLPPRFKTCVYTIVVVTSLCPNNS